MKKLLILIFITLLSVASVSADGFDDQGQPNDPTTNERANACFEGGSMEDANCTTDWEWICGWHLIRWENDMSYVMPATCQILIPPPPPVAVSEPAVVVPAVGCMITTPDFYENRDEMPGGVVLVITSPSFINSCGDVMTPTVQLVSNVSQSVPSNIYVCDTVGLPYEIRVIWSSVSGSFTEFRTGNCVAVLPT